MVGQMDGPEDGGIYADGCEVRIRPLRSGTGVTMGGPIAEAQSEETAAEIARRCSAFEPLLAALKAALPDIVEGLEAHVRCTTRLAFTWQAGEALPSTFDEPESEAIARKKSAVFGLMVAAIARGEGG